MNFFTKEKQSHRLRKETMVPRKEKCGSGRKELFQSNIGKVIL